MSRQDRERFFAELHDKTSAYKQWHSDLVLLLDLDAPTFQQMRAASAKYLMACFGADAPATEDKILDSITEASLPMLANRTPNGAVLPKLEVAREFNELQQCIGKWVKSLKLDNLVSSIFCPITLRIMSGQGDPAVANRPYATSKIHADVWAGDPGDGVNVIISLCGDIERTTVEFYHPPADFEQKFLRHLKDYDEGREYVQNGEPYPAKFRVGSVFFFDAIVPHKTVRKGGNPRGTIQFNLRRKVSDAALKQFEANCDKGKLVNFIGLNDWCELGKSRFLNFEATLADARKGDFAFQPYSSSFYTIVDRL